MIDELISYIPESSYSDKKMLKLYTGLAKNGVVISNGDGESTATPDQSPLIVKAETPGNKNHKAVVTRLRDDDGVYKVQSAHVVPFNKKGSVSPLTLSSVDIEDSFVSTGYDRFARFGEKQPFDTFIDCIDDLTGIFPSSFLNVLPRGSVMRAYDGYSYRSLCYYIDTFLEASPGIYFGSESNTGGLLGFPLDGKASFQLVKQGTDAVLSISEGTRITSGLYRNDGSGMLKKSASATDWESDASLDLVTKWNNYLESIESDSSGNDGFEIEIHDGKKGLCSFWLDLSGLENVEQNHIVEDFEIYAIGNDPSVIDPTHWAETLGAGSTFTVQNFGGSQYGRLTGGVGTTSNASYTFDVGCSIIPSRIMFQCGVNAGGVGNNLSVYFLGSPGGWAANSLIVRMDSVVGGINLGEDSVFVGVFGIGVPHTFEIELIDWKAFDIWIDGVFYNNNGAHYRITSNMVFPVVGLLFYNVSGAASEDIYFDNIYISYIVGSGLSSWIEVSETRDFLDDALARIYFNKDEIYNEGALLHRNINFKHLHRVTLAWDYTGATPVNTFRLDDLDTKDFTWEDGGSALVNGFAINALRVAANYCPVRVHGFCQSGDYFPFVHAESNKQNYMPFNLDLLEKVTGILGPNRRDTEGFKNLRATQPMSVDMDCYALGNVVGQGSWTADAADDWNGTTILHDIVSCGDTDAFFALKGLRPYGYEGFTRYIEGQEIKDINGWNNWNSNLRYTFVKSSGKALFTKLTGLLPVSDPIYSLPIAQPNADSGWASIDISFSVIPTANPAYPIIWSDATGNSLITLSVTSAGLLRVRHWNGSANVDTSTGLTLIVGASYTINAISVTNGTFDITVNGVVYDNGGLHWTKDTGRITSIGKYSLWCDDAICTFTIDNITTSWNCPGPDVLATTPVGKGRVLKIYDKSGALNIYIYRTIFNGTLTPNGRMSFAVFPVAGAAGNIIDFYIGENAAGRVHIILNMNTGLISINNRAAAPISTTLSLNLGQVNYLEFEWTIVDKNADTFSDCRAIVNGVYSVWISTEAAIAVGLNRFFILTTVANNDIECYISDITNVDTGLAFDSALTKPGISYPDGDFLDVRYLQRARYPDAEPYVRLMNASGNGTEQRLTTLNNTAAMDHRVDEVATYIPSTQTNYRVLGAGGVNAQWTDGLIPNHWLPLALTHQIHAKYPRLFTHDTFYNRYQFCYSAMTALITEYSRIIVSNLNYENCAEMEFTPSVHPFIHPNNIAFYRDCGNALPEKFGNSPQRMRKAVLVPQEFFSDYVVDADIVAASAAWTDGGGASATEYLKCVMDEGKKVGKWNENLGAGTYTITHTFPMPSPTIPGVYSISFKVKVGTTQFFISFGDAAAAGRTVLQFDTANYSISNANGPVLIGNNLWGAADEYSRYYEYTIFFVGIDKFYLVVDGIVFYNAGAYYTNTGNFTGAITRVNVYGAAASLSNAKIEYISPNWKKYPDIDADDFIIHPQYLGHAKPVEIVSLEDKWGFRDYGKYTAISNAHPTRSWVSFFITAPYGMDEGQGEVILYDIAGNEMLYIQVTPMNATDYSVHPKVMQYASTSAGGLTTIDGTWNGWLPVTVEFNNDSRKGNIYFHGQLVAGDITLGAGALVGFGKVVFLSGLKTVAPVAGVWRQEDFQTYAEAAAPGAPWTLVAGGGTSFTARYLDGDARGYFSDVDAAATLSATLTFPIPSTAAPAAIRPYAIKWSQNIMTLANNGYVISIFNTVPANGEVRMQVRAGGLLWNDAGAGYVNTNIVLPFPTLEHEIMVQFVTNATFNVFVDGVLQNAAALTCFAAFVAVITDIEFYTAANADSAQVYFDDIDVSWSDCVQTADIHHIHGSLLVDGITFGGYDNSNKDFSSQTKNLFMLPYRYYINPHHSTFHNNLNGPTLRMSETFEAYLIGDVPSNGWTVTGTDANSYFKTIAGQYGQFWDKSGGVNLNAKCLFGNARSALALDWIELKVKPVSLANGEIYICYENAAAAIRYTQVWFSNAGNIGVTHGGGNTVLQTWVSGVWYTIRFIVIDATHFQIVIGTTSYGGSIGYTVMAGNMNTSALGSFTINSNTSSGEINIDDLVLSWYGSFCDIIPLPPYNAAPSDYYNSEPWFDGLYWDFYSKKQTGMYGGIVRNWYAWNFPYVFGGRFDEPNKDVKSIARLYHDVSNTDKNTSGKWEFVFGASARQVYSRKDDFTAYLDGALITGSNGWTIFEGAATSCRINGYKGKKVIDFYDASAVDYCMATNLLPMVRDKVNYFHVKIENELNTKQFVVQTRDSAARYVGSVRFQTTGQIQVLQAGVYSDIVAYAALTEYDVLIKADFVIGKWWVWINNVLYGGMVGYDFGSVGANNFNDFRLLTDSGETTYHAYAWDVYSHGEPGSVDVTIDFDHLHTSALVEIPTPPMDICEKWQLQFVPAVIGTKAMIQGDGIAEDFQQYAAGVVPTTGWTITGATATAWFKTIDAGSNIAGSFYDNDAASWLLAKYTFVTSSASPIPLRTWISFDITPVTIAAPNDFLITIRSALFGVIYLNVYFTASPNNLILVSHGGGALQTGTWISGTKYHVQIIVVSDTKYDIIINNVLFDNAGAHYTNLTAWTAANILGCIQFGSDALAAVNANVYIDNIAASWLRAPTTIANFDKAKALHKYTVEWDTGFIWTYIDDKLVDSRKYAGRVPFYLDKFRAHVCSGYGLHEIYAVMFGAQCDNEVAYEPNCLDLIPGGTMEQEGYTGILNTRNKGTYALLNSKDAWTLEKTNFWKTIMLDSGGLPVLGNFDDIQNDLVELEKKAVGHRSNVYNNANKV